MSRLSRVVIVAAAIACFAADAAMAQDAEFEALRREARAKAAERAARGPEAAPAPAAPRGPSLARYMPRAIAGWRLSSNLADDAAGILDLNKEISGDYSRTNRSQSSRLDVTIRRRGGAADSVTGVIRMGRSTEDRGMMTSETRIAGLPATRHWDEGEHTGQVWFRAGKFDVVVKGRGVTLAELEALAGNVDVKGLLAR